jgi:DNA-binding transcriptional LysR family regulator
VNQTEVAARACAAGVGIGSFFAYQVAGELASGALRVLLEPYELPPRPIHVVYPQARLLPARTRSLIDFFLQHIQAEQGAWQRAGGRQKAGRAGRALERC